MTRINTNVSSLVAQNSLAKSNVELNVALTRLSTGLRINSGRDDPSGLISSEILKSDIANANQAITNSQTANEMISTADSALGEVSGMLTDIRTLISAAANDGTLSTDQINAYQQQINDSLQAINRVASTTEFQGRTLLDGSLAFSTSGIDSTKVSDLNISQASNGTQKGAISVKVIGQATKASLTYSGSTVATDTKITVSGANGSSDQISLAANSSLTTIAKSINSYSDATGVEAVVANGVVDVANSAGNAVISGTANNSGLNIKSRLTGANASNVNVKYVLNATSGVHTSAAFTAASNTDDANAGTLVVTLESTAWAQTTTMSFDAASDARLTLKSAMSGADWNGYTFNVTTTAGATTWSADTATKKITLAYNAGDDIATVIGAAAGDANFSNMFTVGSNGGANTANNIDVAMLSANASGRMTVGATTGGLVDANATANAVRYAIAANTAANAALEVSLANGSDGSGVVNAFSEYAYSGTVAEDNYMQILAPSTSPNIKLSFVAGTANQTLSANVSNVAKATGTYQSTAANSSLTIAAKNVGEEYSGTTISIQSTTDPTYVIYDKSAKTLTVYANAADMANMAHIANAIDNDPYANQYWDATSLGTSAAIAGTSFATAIDSTATGTVTINLATDATGSVTTSANDLIKFLNTTTDENLKALGLVVTNSSTSAGTGKLTATTSDITLKTNGATYTPTYSSANTIARGGQTSQLSFTAKTKGATYDGVKVVFADTLTSTSASQVSFAYSDTTKTLTVNISSGNTTAAQVANAYDALGNSDTVKMQFTVDSLMTRAAATGAVYSTDTATLAGGAGSDGVQEGMSLLNKDAASTAKMTLQATEYGSANSVKIVTSTGSFATVDGNNIASNAACGTDIQATINGIKAVGAGLTASLSTSALSMAITLSDTMAAGDSLDFIITGGGAQFQLGTQVVSNQQVVIGINSVTTSTLGNTAGSLADLSSGEKYSLTGGDLTTSAAIVDSAINQITTLRGKLGTLQSTTLETNISSLSSTVEALTEAKSMVEDADFAAETANLTRAQILVQSGTSVLKIANQNPQNVLSLLSQ